MGMKVGEKDILGYGGMLIMALSWGALWGVWAGLGIIGCFLAALGGERS